VGGLFEHYRIAGNSQIQPFTLQIPLDWSAALYPIFAGVITPGSVVKIPGLDPGDVQGDKMAVDILKQMGADINVTKTEVIARSSKLHAIEVDCNDFVDQFMLLAMACAHAEGTSRLFNAEICRHKECDRISAMQSELSKMGVKVTELQDGLIIEGRKKLKGAKINGFMDHRMVMTFAVGALNCVGETIISDAESVAKSFDNFVPEMQGAGANFKLLKS
jgi:3-phosphoshikimate 1-carboxyvinyltransferase